MCRHGETVSVSVLIAADLSFTGHPRIKHAEIDRCIAPIVHALSKAGIHMRASCCGHGHDEGRIDLADGRVLRIETKRQEALEAGA